MIRKGIKSVSKVIKPSGIIQRLARSAGSVQNNNRRFMDQMKGRIEKLSNEEEIGTNFANYMYRVYSNDIRVQKKTKYYFERLEGCFWHSDEAVKQILLEFNQSINDLGFNVDIMVKAFQEIGKVVSARHSAGITGIELEGNFLFENPDFQNLIEVFLYSLRDGNFINGSEIGTVLNVLSSIGLKDIMIQRAVQRKLTSQDFYEKCELPPSAPLEEENPAKTVRTPMIGRKGFPLNPRKLDEDSANSIFQEYLQKVHDLAFEDQKETTVIKKVDFTDEDEKELSEFEFELEELESLVNKSKDDMSKLFEGVTKLREDYLQLTKVQKRDYIMENTSLLSDLLQVEEMLLGAGVIDILDVVDLVQGRRLSGDFTKMGPIMRQFLVENNLPADFIDNIEGATGQADKVQNMFNFNEKKEASTKYSHGIYKDTLIEGLEALVRYASLQCEDITSRRGYIIEGIEKLVDENYEELRYAREKSDFGLADEVDIFVHPSVDLKALKTPSVHFHKSLEEISRFFSKIFTASNPNLQGYYAKADILSEFKGDQVSLTKLNRLIEQIFTKVDITISGDRQPAKEVNQVYRRYFEEGDLKRKVGVLYELACISFENDQYQLLFLELWGKLTKTEELRKSLTNFSQHKIVPLPEHFERVVLISLYAKNNGARLGTEFTRFFRELSINEDLHKEFIDNKDPFLKIASNYVKLAFAKDNSEDLQNAIEMKILNTLPQTLRPMKYIKNNNGENIALFLTQPKDHFYGNQAISSNYSKKFMIICEYFSQIIGEKVSPLVLCPESVFTPNESGQYYLTGKVSIRKDINNVLLKLRNDVYELKLQGNENEDEQEQTPLNKFEATLYEITGDNTPISDSLKEVVGNYLHLYSTTKATKLNATTLNILQNLVYILFTEFKRFNTEEKDAFSQFFGLEQTEVEAYLKSISTELSELPQPENADSVVFQGKRLGLEVISNNAEEIGELPGIELANYNFLRDPEFYSYSNWKQILENNYQNEVIPLSGTATFTHENSAYGQRYIPKGTNFSNFLKPNNFSMNWEVYAFSPFQHRFDELKGIEALVYDSPEEAEAQLIYNIERMKHQIKTTEDLSQAMLGLGQFEVTEKLIDFHLESLKNKETENLKTVFDSSQKKLPRNFNSYLESLNRKAGIRYEDNEYKNIVKQEASYVEETNYWRDVLYEKIPMIFQKLKDQKKTTKGLQEFKIYVQKKYFRALRKLDGRKRDKVTSTSSQPIKEHIFELTYDESIFDEKSYYDIKNDLDFIAVGEDENKYMGRIKIKAETNFIKYTIITKLLNEIDLSESEQEYLQLWKTSVAKGDENSILPSTYSSLTMKNLSPKDIQHLSEVYEFTFLPEFNQFSLNELVFEFNEIINQDLITQFEECLRFNRISSEWGIKQPLGSFKLDGVNNTKKLLLDKVEKLQWKKSMKYTEEEITNIKKMFSLGRGVSPYDKLMLEKDLESLEGFIDSVNELEIRDDLLNRWLQRKHAEIRKRSKFIIKELMMNDEDLASHYREYRTRKISDKVSQIFNKGYEEVTSDDLSIFIENLTQRLYLFKNYLPSSLNFLLVGVVEHPNLARKDRELIQNSLALFDIDLNEQFDADKLAQVPVLKDDNTAINSLRFSDSENIQDLFKTANYDVGTILTRKLHLIQPNH